MFFFLKKLTDNFLEIKKKPKIFNLNDFNNNIIVKSNAFIIIKKIQSKGFDAFVVGGAVRDLISNVKPKDFDVVTNANPEQIINIFRNSRIIGKRFKLVHVYFGKEIIEVSTFRSGKTFKDKFGRIVNDNHYGTLEDDANLRDFTVNALFLDPIKNEIYDFGSGLDDLKKRVLRIIGNPRKRYQEDPVRMIRALRISSKLDLKIDDRSFKEIVAMKSLIKYIPKARIFEELCKIFFSGVSSKCLDKMRKTGVLEHVIPDLNLQLKKEQNKLFFFSALDETDKRVKAKKSISLSFIVAVIYWFKIKDQIENISKDSIKKIEESFRKIILMSDNIIPKRFLLEAKEIWLFQLILSSKRKKNSKKILIRRKFKLAYDFLNLRSKFDANEVENFKRWKTTLENKNKL